MMQWYTYAFMTVLATLCLGQSPTPRGPTIPLCDQNVISLIKNYWKTAPQPENPLKGLADGEPLTIVHTSYNRTTAITKCLHMKFHENNVTLTLDTKTGNLTINVTYGLEQSGDVIRGKYPVNTPGSWDWYTISNNNGVVVSYVCGEGAEGTQDPPVFAISAANSVQNPMESLEVTKMYSLLQSWGINFVRSYGPECFN